MTVRARRRQPGSAPANNVSGGSAVAIAGAMDFPFSVFDFSNRSSDGFNCGKRIAFQADVACETRFGNNHSAIGTTAIGPASHIARSSDPNERKKSPWTSRPRFGTAPMTSAGWRALRDARQAVAAIEFAIAAPFLLLMLAGAIDFGFRQWTRSCLANAVAQGAYQAFLTGPTVTAANIQTMVQEDSSLSGVAVKRIGAPASYCPSGSPAALGAAVAAGATCPDGTTAGVYLTIVATYTPVTFLPSYSGLSGKALTETATVRLQ